jgi:Acyl-CoA carboxylase epsilon subunit
VTGPDRSDRAPLLVIRGDASDEEVAALVAVLQGLSAVPRRSRQRPASEWSAPDRAIRTPPGPARTAWRRSALPR